MSDLHLDVKKLVELVCDLDDCAVSDNLEADLIALTMLKEARTNLAIVERDLEQALAQAMAGKNLIVEGVGTFERTKKKNRTQWDKDDLLRVVIDSRKFDPMTGELIDETPLDRVLACWNLPAPRLTALRDRGIDVDEFCHSEDAGWAIRLIS
jgi:hypothetical protein